MSFGYSTSSWAWIVLKDGKMVGDFYATQDKAKKAASECGGEVKKVRY